MKIQVVTLVAAALLLAACTGATRTQPTVAPGTAPQVETSRPVATQIQASEPSATAPVLMSPTSTGAPATLALPTLSPTERPPETIMPTMASAAVATPTRLPTERPTQTSAPAATPAATPAPVATAPMPSPTVVAVETRIPTPPLPTSTAPAATSPKPGGAGWRGQYFANADLSGTPVFERSDGDVSFDWGAGSPDPRIPVDHFSARWTRAFTFAAGQWRFFATVDDGVRVYVDGIPMIDRWQTGAAVTFTSSFALGAGNHDVRVDYYDDTEQARVRVWWAPDDNAATDPAHSGVWRGQYYDNTSLSDTPKFERDDPAVYFDWGTDGPGGGVGGSEFSVHWTRQVFFPAGKYLFSLATDDGVRLRLDSATVIDQWHVGSGQTYTQSIDVPRGTHTVELDYYQSAGSAYVKLSWQDTSVNWVANLHTCLPPQDAWIKVYRLAPNDQWEDLNPGGYGPIAADGRLDLAGLPIDASFGWDGQPYKVEQWVSGNLVRSEGNIMAGQPELRLTPNQNVTTTWPCG